MRLSAFLLTAAAFLGPIAQGQEKAFDSPYMPLKVGHRWTYRSGDHKVLVRVEALELFKVARKDPQGKDQTYEALVARLAVTSGERTLTEHVGVLEDGIYRFTAAGKAIEPPLRILKLPVKIGETWTCSSTSAGKELAGTFSSREEAVQVPAQAQPLLTRTASSRDFRIGDRRMDVDYWFAPEVGMVKQVFASGDMKVVLELEKFEPAK